MVHHIIGVHFKRVNNISKFEIVINLGRFKAKLYTKVTFLKCITSRTDCSFDALFIGKLGKILSIEFFR